MQFRNIAAVGAAAFGLLAAESALAQATPTVVIAFTSGATSLPLDPWSTVTAALLIAVMAVMIFRRGRTGKAIRPGHWIAFAVAVAGAALTLSQSDIVRSAHAIMFTPLTASPTSVAIGGGSGFFTAQNATGAPITILSITIANPAPGQALQFPATTCAPPAVLAAGATCDVSIVVSGG